MALVINLARRTDRLASMTALNLPFDWERLGAVDGRTLSWDALQGRIHADAIEEAKYAERQAVPTICRQLRSFSPHLTLAAAGCGLSHRKAWEALLASPHEFALIMEDDLSRVAPRLEDKLKALLTAVLPGTWQICFLGFHESSGRLLPASSAPQVAAVPRGACITGLYAYLLTKAAAKALLQPGAIFPLRTQVDVAVAMRPWPEHARFAIDPQAVLVQCPKSEEGACDTDVQTLGEPGERAHANVPPGWQLL